MPNLWERQDGETDKSFAAFCAYRDMARPRSLDGAYRFHFGTESAHAPGYFKAWSSANSWESRVAAYDAHMDSVRLSATEDSIRKDLLAYRDTVRREAAEFAEVARGLLLDAKRMDDKIAASLITHRANSVWEKARQVEGVALGLVGGDGK